MKTIAFKVCRISSSYAKIHLNLFSLEMFNNMIPAISRGIPEFEIKPFEPMIIEKIDVHRSAGQVITLTGSFNDVQVRGPSNSSITKANLNLDKKIMNFNLDIPRLRINASYNLNGTFEFISVRAISTIY